MTAVVVLLVIFGIEQKVLNGASKVNGWFKELGTISLGMYVVHILLLGRVRDAVVVLLCMIVQFRCTSALSLSFSLYFR